MVWRMEFGAGMIENNVICREKLFTNVKLKFFSIIRDKNIEILFRITVVSCQLTGRSQEVNITNR